MFTIYHNSTRGGLYRILLALHEDGTYVIKEFKRHQLQGMAFLGQKSAVDAVAEYNRRIDDAAKYDGIFYTKDLKPMLEAQS